MYGVVRFGTLVLAEASMSEMLVTTYQSVRRHISKYWNLQTVIIVKFIEVEDLDREHSDTHITQNMKSEL
jgi:hypothetical protein